MKNIGESKGIILKLSDRKHIKLFIKFPYAHKSYLH